MGQRLIVESFELAPNDLTASTQRRNDLNGDACALIKVQLTKPGAVFQGNVMGDTPYSNSVYWVYMTKGSKMLEVQLEGFIPVKVNFLDYGIKGLESLNTYILTINTPGAGAVDDGTSYFTLTVTPKNAIVSIDGGEPKTLSIDGVYSDRLRRGTHRYKLSATGYQSKESTFRLGRERVDLVDTLQSAMASLTVRCATPDADIYIDDIKRGKGTWSGTLLPRNYLVEARMEGYNPQRKSITLKESQSMEVELPALEALKGVLDVNYMPVASEVWVDGEKIGTSPNVFQDIHVGSHKVEIKKDGYETKTEMVTIKTGETTHLRGSLTQQVSAPPSQPTPPTSPTTPTPPVSTSSSTTSLSFYAEGKFQAGMMMGAGASVGAYIYGLNVEGTFLLGLAESEEIAWRQTSQSGNSGYSYTYKPMFYGLKLGYRIPSESKFRFTPQVGIGVASISGSQVQKGSGTDPGATSCYAVPASVGVRLEYNISKNFGVSASPEFSFPVMKSDTYTKLSDLSSKVKGFGSGFNARVGLFVSF